MVILSVKGYVIDIFFNENINLLGEWYGLDEGMVVIFGNNVIIICINDFD